MHRKLRCDTGYISPWQVELTILVDELDKEIQLSSASFLEPSLVHGLTATVLQRIVSQAPYLFSVDDIIDRCSISNYSTVLKLVEIFSEIFGDMNADIDIDEDMGR